MGNLKVQSTIKKDFKSNIMLSYKYKHLKNITI